MAAQWYSIVVGILLFILGILLFNGAYEISGLAYAWAYLVIGLLGVIAGFMGSSK